MNAPIRYLVVCIAVLACRAFAAAPPADERSFDFSAMHTGSGDVNTAPGSVSADGFTVSHDMSHLLRVGLFQGGFAWSETEVDHSDGILLPGRLHTFAIHFGGVTEIRPGIRPILRITPSLAADAYKFSNPNMNLEVLLAVRHEYSPDSVLTIGLDGRVHADNSWIPIVSYTRNLSPTWVLDLGFPASSLTFSPSTPWQWKLSAEAESNAWHITRNPPAVSNTYLDYREIRTGLGLAYTVNANFTFGAEAGLASGRRFTYYDRGIRLKVDSAPYLRVSAKARF